MRRRAVLARRDARRDGRERRLERLRVRARREARSCARRSFAAATIFIAFVICCVFFTLRIRRRMSMRLAMSRRCSLDATFASGLVREEELLRLGDRGRERVLDLLRELLAVADSRGRGLLVRRGTRGAPPRTAGRPRRGRSSRKPFVPAKTRRSALDVHRDVLVLLEDLDEALAAVELRLRRLVEVGAELREGRELAELREVEAERAGDRAHGLDLRGAADARHRDADVDGGAHARVEEVGLEEDLPVRDRDDVRRDVGRDVAGLRLDDRQRRERAAAVLLVELRWRARGARVQVEDVAGIRLAARRAAEEERDLAVRRPPAWRGRRRCRARACRCT